MSTSTAEMPINEVVLRPDPEELRKLRAYDAAVARRLQEVSGEHHEQQKGWFRQALEWVGNKVKQAWNWFTGKIRLGAKWIAETTRKIWGSTKRTVKQVWDWSTDKSKRAWSWMKDKAKRAWNWTKINGRKAWNWTKVNTKKAWNSTKVNGKKIWNWTKVNGQKIWSWGRRTWIGASVASRVASLAGVGIFGGLIGVPLLMVVGLATAAFLLISSSAPTKTAKEIADEKVVVELLAGKVLPLNLEQERALYNLLQKLQREHQEMLDADHISPAQHSNYIGQKEFVRARVMEKSTATRADLFEKYKQSEAEDWADYIPSQVAIGMRDAEIKVNKLLVEHQDQKEPVVV